MIEQLKAIAEKMKQCDYVAARSDLLVLIEQMDNALVFDVETFVCEAGYDVPCVGKCPVCGQDENSKCGGGDKCQ